MTRGHGSPLLASHQVQIKQCYVLMLSHSTGNKSLFLIMYITCLGQEKTNKCVTICVYFFPNTQKRSDLFNIFRLLLYVVFLNELDSVTCLVA